MIGTNRYIGSPVERIEDFRFLRGRGEFVGDLRREGMLHAAILRSPIAHGRIRNLDAAAARAIPGVRTVITAAEIDVVPKIPLRLLPPYQGATEDAYRQFEAGLGQLPGLGD